MMPDETGRRPVAFPDRPGREDSTEASGGGVEMERDTTEKDQGPDTRMAEGGGIEPEEGDAQDTPEKGQGPDARVEQSETAGEGGTAGDSPL